MLSAEENKDDIVHARLNKQDGRNDDYAQEITDRSKLAEYLLGLSTFCKIFAVC